MESIGHKLKTERKKKNLALKKAAADLLIKVEILEAIESEEWQKLPHAPFVKGFIQNYAAYLGLNVDHTLALFRRAYDEKKYIQKDTSIKKIKPAIFTPIRLINTLFFLSVAIFVVYLALQYFSILQSPKLEVITPEQNAQTTIPIVKVTGITEKEATISVDGKLIGVDQDGNFTTEVNLDSGKNIITIIATKKLSPKAKIQRTVRLVN